MTADPRFFLDKNLARHSFDKAADHYDEVAVLQREVGTRMLDRLNLVRINPEVIIDAGCGTGVATDALLKRYRNATVLGLDIAPAMLRITGKRGSWFRKPLCICGDGEDLPLQDASCDMVFSNLMLQWCNNPDRVFQEFHRILKPGGLLMFSTLGPDTLEELRYSWAAADDYNHVNAFIDMHDIGDGLIRARLAEPVMDMEVITLTYRDISLLMRDLKKSGAHNITAGRARGLTGKGRLKLMGSTYERFRQDGLLPATYEVIYGHAWGSGKPPVRTQDKSTAVVPLSRLRRREPR